MRYYVRDDSLYVFTDEGVERRLGPREDVYAYPREFPSLRPSDGVHTLSLPGRLDFVFAAGPAVVGGESKRPNDFVASRDSRRLSRQLRLLVEVVDIPVLALRGGVLSFNEASLRDALVDLVGVQCGGVYILPLPDDDRAALKLIREYQEVLRPESSRARRAFAGTDERKRDGQGGLLRTVKGIGPAMERRLRAEIGDTLEVLQEARDRPDILRALKIPEAVIQRLQEGTK